MLIARAVIRPYYGQLEISDSEKTDYPQFDTGAELVVSTPDCVVVTTRRDEDGDVVVEVWTDEIEAKAPIEMIHCGILEIRGHCRVGNTAGNHFVDVPIAPGRHQIKVFTCPAGAPAEAVYVLVGPGDATSARPV